MVTITYTYWDEVPEVSLEAMLKDLAMQAGKAKVREHPMPGYSPAAPPPKTPPPVQGTYTQARPNTYTPERVLTEMIWEVINGLPQNMPKAAYPAFRARQMIEGLKLHGFEITPIMQLDPYANQERGDPPRR